MHVPFCARRCTYCDFSIAVRRRVPGRAFVDLIRRERQLLESRGGWPGEPFETVYLGGGTPSLLPADDIAALLGALQGKAAERGPSAQGTGEVTLEANPDDVTPLAAAAWAAAGVNRVSLGAQSFQPEVLTWMRRTHGAGATERAVARLRQAGITNISLDLIFAVPPDLGRRWGEDLDRALALEPSHVSIYGLTVEPRTPLARWVAAGRLAPPGDERYADEFLEAHERLSAAGLEHYEVSNYARPGVRARHNAAYWSGRPYLGLGPSAHSFDGSVRRWNVSAYAEYERRLTAGQDPAGDQERLDPSQHRFERVYLGLRTADGIRAQEAALLPAGVLDGALQRGWAWRRAGRVGLTPAGWLVLDEIAVLTTSARGG